MKYLVRYKDTECYLLDDPRDGFVWTPEKGTTYRSERAARQAYADSKVETPTKGHYLKCELIRLDD